MSPMHVSFIVEADPCPECGKGMLPHLSAHQELFPRAKGLQFEDQVRAKGLVFRSSLRNKDERHICEDCAKAGKATFTCFLCRMERKTLDEIQYELGDPPDFLCTTCYTTTTAKQWGDAVDELEEAHKYDYSM